MAKLRASVKGSGRCRPRQRRELKPSVGHDTACAKGERHGGLECTGEEEEECREEG